MTARIELTLVGELDHLRVVWQAGESLIENVPFAGDADAARYDVLVAVQEIVTNVLRHAYKGQTQDPVRVEFAVDDRAFSVTIADRGPAFDPCALTPPQVRDRAPDCIGGWGITIVRTTMDEIEYARRDGWNILRIAKRLPIASAAGAHLTGKRDA
jgi:anti-sigma regulatory factor (Ser/Thr protein kinase)